MNQERAYYIIEKVPSNMIRGADNTQKPMWYCHRKGFPYIPVFGSIGTKQHAAAVCRTYNMDGKVRYS